MARSHSKRGLFVAIVGPDGVGKTSVAERVLEDGRGNALYFHFCPTPAGPLRPFVDLGPAPPPPRGPEQGSAVVGYVRLLRSLVRFWWAYLIRIRPAVRRGSLVVADRWCYGYQASPRNVRYYGPNWLARLAMRVFPQPDLILNLTAEPGVIAGRKQELTVEEIERELRGWGSLRGSRRVDVDATADVTATVKDVHRILEDAGWSR